MTDLHEAALAVQAQEAGIANLRNALNTYEAAQGLASEMHALEQLQIAARPAVLRRLLDAYDRPVGVYQTDLIRGAGWSGCHDTIEAGDTEGGSCD